MQLVDDIVKILEDVKSEIQGNFSSQGINASGRTSASIRVEQYDGGIRLVGGNNSTHNLRWFDGSSFSTWDTAPFSTIEKGDKPTTRPAYFYQILYFWSKDKGIQFNKDSERKTFAYFLSKKIMREGTERFKNNADVFSSAVANGAERIRGLIKDFVNKSIFGAKIKAYKV